MADICAAVLHCLFGANLASANPKKAASFERHTRFLIEENQKKYEIHRRNALDPSLDASSRLYSIKAAALCQAMVRDGYDKLNHMLNGHAIIERTVHNKQFASAVRAMGVPGVSAVEKTNDSLQSQREEIEDIMSALGEFPLAAAPGSESEDLNAELEKLLKEDEENAMFQQEPTAVSLPEHAGPQPVKNYMETLLLSSPTIPHTFNIKARQGKTALMS
jgi:hypothetical protein